MKRLAKGTIWLAARFVEVFERYILPERERKRKYDAILRRMEQNKVVMGKRARDSLRAYYRIPLPKVQSGSKS